MYYQQNWYGLKTVEKDHHCHMKVASIDGEAMLCLDVTEYGPSAKGLPDREIALTSFYLTRGAADSLVNFLQYALQNWPE